MAASGGNTSSGAPPSAAALLANVTITPIAQLHPDLVTDQNTRAVRGEVTIVWPYNSVSRSLGFLLAESDVRLRRSKGQIRVQLHGPSADAVAGIGLGGGDEISLGLDGASWSPDESALRLPGTRVEWQLEYTGKIVLQANVGEPQESHDVYVDQPESQTGNATDAHHPQNDEAEQNNQSWDTTNGRDTNVGRFTLPPSSPQLPAHNSRAVLKDDEYASPAFIKRARISFGSLFEPGFDIFEEDGGVRGRGRKRTRFGRPSNAWRYSSQSVSPEREENAETTTPDRDNDQTDKLRSTLESSEVVEVSAAIPASSTVATSSTPVPRPKTTDEASQTIEAGAQEDDAVATTPLQTQPQIQPSPQSLPAHFDTPTPAPRQERPPEKEVELQTITATQEPKAVVNPFAGQEKTSKESSNPLSSALFGSSASTANSLRFGNIPSSSAQPGADAMGFIPDDSLFNDQVRFTFGQPTSSAFGQPVSQPSASLPEPATESGISAPASDFSGLQYQYPEPPSQNHGTVAPLPLHDTSFGHALQDARDFGIPAPSHDPPPPAHLEHRTSSVSAQDQMLVWPIQSPALVADHAEGVVAADTVPPSPPPNRPAPEGEVDEGVNDGVFEEEEKITDLPREVDDYGYNDRRYQNEAEEEMVNMVDEPNSPHSSEEDLVSEEPEEAEPKDHLVGEGDEEVDVEADEDVEAVEQEEEDEEDEEDDDIEEKEATDEAGDDYDMRNYVDVDDDIEGNNSLDQGPAVTFNGKRYGEDGDEDGEEDEEDDEADQDEDEFDEDAEAEEEEGYAAPQKGIAAAGDDEEEGEEEEDEGEALGSEEYDEEEEEYDEEEEEDDENPSIQQQNQGFRRPQMYQPPQQQKDPVVIDLLSDSDEDEPPPPPRTQPRPPIVETPIPPPVMPKLSQQTADARQSAVATKEEAPPSSPPAVSTEEATEEDEEEQTGESEDEGEAAVENEIEDEDEGIEREEGGQEGGQEEGEADEEEAVQEGNATSRDHENGQDDATDDEVVLVKTGEELKDTREDVLKQGAETENPRAEATQQSSQLAEKLPDTPTQPQTHPQEDKEPHSEAEDEVEKELEADLEAELAKETEQATQQEPEKVPEPEPDIVARTEPEAELVPVPESESMPELEPEKTIPKLEVTPQVPEHEATISTAEEGTSKGLQPQAEGVIVEQHHVAESHDPHATEDVDVVMAEPEAEDNTVQVEETSPLQPPSRTVTTSRQAVQEMQAETAAVTAATPFSPPPTQSVASQSITEGLHNAPSLPRPVSQAAEAIPTTSGSLAVPHNQPPLLTPRVTQEGTMEGVSQFTELASFSEVDIDGLVQSQLMSEMAMSFDFDKHADVDMRSVIGEKATDHVVQASQTLDVVMEDRGVAQEPSQVTPAIHSAGHDDGDAMDVDGGTDVDMQSFVSEVPTLVIEEVANKQQSTGNGAIRDESSVLPSSEGQDASTQQAVQQAQEIEAEDEKPSEQDEGQAQSQPLRGAQSGRARKEDGRSSSTSSPPEKRHKMSLRSTQGRSRKSASPQPVTEDVSNHDNKATTTPETDLSVMLARAPTTRRSKRTRQASNEPEAVATSTATDASFTSPPRKTRSAAAAKASSNEPNVASRLSAEASENPDVSVLLARASVSKKEQKQKSHPEKDSAEGKKAAPREELLPARRPPPSSMVEVKRALERARTRVPECVSLHALRQHLKTTLDVAVVAASASPTPQRTKTRQFAMSFTTTDPSLLLAAVPNSKKTDTEPDVVVEVRLFRAHKDTMPTFQPGDGLLLRRFEVVALADKAFGLQSTDESAYAVFPSRSERAGTGEGDGQHQDNNDRGDDDGELSPEPQVNGPPVEDMDNEARYIALLKQWYRFLGDEERAELAAANERFAAVDAAQQAKRLSSQ